MIIYTCVIKPLHGFLYMEPEVPLADTAWEVGRGSLAPSRDSVAQRQMGKTFINPGKTGTDGNSKTRGGMGWDRSDTLGYGVSPKHGAVSCVLVV